VIPLEKIQEVTIISTVVATISLENILEPFSDKGLDRLSPLKKVQQGINLISMSPVDGVRSARNDNKLTVLISFGSLAAVDSMAKCDRHRHE